MEDQHDRKNWNDRWERQIAEWEEECSLHLLQAEALLALIELAKSQLEAPPE